MSKNESEIESENENENENENEKKIETIELYLYLSYNGNIVDENHKSKRYDVKAIYDPKSDDFKSIEMDDTWYDTSNPKFCVSSYYLIGFKRSFELNKVNQKIIDDFKASFSYHAYINFSYSQTEIILYLYKLMSEEKEKLKKTNKINLKIIIKKT